jgi:transmembrane sensor
MNTKDQNSELITQIYDTASDWLIRHRSSTLDEAEKRAFDAWLRKSPEHIRAYLEMSSIWEDVSSLNPGWNASADELITRARADSNVFSLEVPESGASLEVPGSGVSGVSAQSPYPRNSRPRLRIFALAASVLIATAGLSAWYLTQRNTYSTGIGEQRTIALEDGSTLELNSRSRVKIQFTEHERDVQLLTGQALFRVAKDHTRPFVVNSNGTRVRAVGTQFDVYKKQTGTIVTVVEGRVAVLSDISGPPSPLTHRESSEAESASNSLLTATSDPDTANSPRRQAIFLAAGEQLTVTPTAAASPKPANIDAATAWTQQKLVFDYAPLTEVAEEFNRYNTRQLIADRDLEQFHINGVFSSADPSLLLRFLRAQPAIEVTETDREIRISRK